MSSNRLVSMRALLCAAALTAGVPALLSGSSAQGQSSGAPLSLKVGAQASPAPEAHPASVASSEEETTPLNDDASHQGIKVHGHWKIVVKNADGSIAQTREFENSLTYTGSLNIASIVSGNTVSAGHAIILETTGTSICGQTACGIVPGSITTGPFSYSCQNGSTALPMVCVTGMTETTSGNSILLAGQLTASQAGTVTTVMTYGAQCLGSVSANACTTSYPYNFSFTSATLPSAVSVVANQTVQVTVTLSFS